LLEFVYIWNNQTNGWRAPFLNTLEVTFQILENYGFLYDNSITDQPGVGPSSVGQMLWPQTLDYGTPLVCNNGECPQVSLPGLWEIPIAVLTDSNNQIVAPMDPEGTTQEIEELFTLNFNNHYNGNKSPFGINLQPSWLEETSDRIGILQQFYAEVSANEDVFFVTLRELIAWMENPISYTEFAKKTACPHPAPIEPCNTDFIHTCSYTNPPLHFSTCASECLRDYPEWNTTLALTDQNSQNKLSPNFSLLVIVSISIIIAKTVLLPCL